MKPILDLWLDADLDDAACDGEDVADDEEDKPAVDKLKPVRPAHFTIQSLPEVAHELLQNKSNRKTVRHLCFIALRLQIKSFLVGLRLFTQVKPHGAALNQLLINRNVMPPQRTCRVYSPTRTQTG